LTDGRVRSFIVIIVTIIVFGEEEMFRFLQDMLNIRPYSPQILLKQLKLHKEPLKILLELLPYEIIRPLPARIILRYSKAFPVLLIITYILPHTLRESLHELLLTIIQLQLLLHPLRDLHHTLLQIHHYIRVSRLVAAY
jgi:hypothetical protein